MPDTTWIHDQSTTLHRDFARDGFVSIPDFLDPDELAEVRTNKARFVREVIPRIPESQVYYEDKNDPSTLKQLQQLGRHDRFFESLIVAGGKFEALAVALLGEPVRPVNMQYFNKPPGIGQPTPPHQDGYYFHLKPNHAVTMWLALEDVAPEQGCMNYVAGSHSFGMRAHGATGTLGFSQGILDFGVENDRENARMFPCKAGHLIAHHALTIHWADANKSPDRSREALGFIYYAAGAEEDTRAKEAYQRQLDQRLASEGKI